MIEARKKENLGADEFAAQLDVSAGAGAAPIGRAMAGKTRAAFRRRRKRIAADRRR